MKVTVLLAGVLAGGFSLGTSAVEAQTSLPWCGVP
jgi:hypothetical protein